MLGVDVNPAPTQEQVDETFEEVKNEIMAIGFDNILTIPRTTDPKTELAVSLLNDAGNTFTSFVMIILLRLCP